MDQQPSFPYYQNPNPNFHHHHPPPPPPPNPNFFFRPPPIQNPNTYSIPPPPPPPIRELSGTLSSLQSLLSECQHTLDSLSQNLALDHSSLLQKHDNGGFVRCPFDPNHLMPPEALFLHSLRCPKPLDLTHLLESFSNYKNKLELPCELLQLNNGDGDLCFSLDEFSDFGRSFFYNDCPGPVNFSELDCKKRTLMLPSVLSVECSDFGGCDEKEEKGVLGKWFGVLPSDVCVVRSEIDQWRYYLSSYFVEHHHLSETLTMLDEVTEYCLMKRIQIELNESSVPMKYSEECTGLGSILLHVPETLLLVQSR